VIPKDSSGKEASHAECSQRAQPAFGYGINTNVNDQRKNAGSMEQVQTQLSHVKSLNLWL